MGTIWELVASIVQVLSLLFLIVYVIKTWEMASATRQAAEATVQSVMEMRDARDLESAPNIVVFFEIPFGSDSIYLVIRNVGKGVATKVRVAIDPPLQSDMASGGFRPEIVGFVKNGIETMPPSHEIRTLLASLKYFRDKSRPLQYSAKITFHGGIRQLERSATMTLDLSAYTDLTYRPEKTMSDLVEQVKQLAAEVRELRSVK